MLNRSARKAWKTLAALTANPIRLETGAPRLTAGRNDPPVKQKGNMQNMIDNLLNGNCSTARKSARRFSQTKIRQFLVDELGWTFERATLCAEYLKTGEGFQAYCDAV